MTQAVLCGYGMPGVFLHYVRDIVSCYRIPEFYGEKSCKRDWRKWWGSQRVRFGTEEKKQAEIQRYFIYTYVKMHFKIKYKKDPPRHFSSAAAPFTVVGIKNFRPANTLPRNTLPPVPSLFLLFRFLSLRKTCSAEKRGEKIWIFKKRRWKFPLSYYSLFFSLSL